MTRPRVQILGAPTPFGTHAQLMSRVVALASARDWSIRAHVAAPAPGPLPPADGYLAAAYTAALGDRLLRVAAPVVNLDGAIDLPLVRVGTDPVLLTTLVAEQLLACRPRSAAYVGTRDRHDSRLLGTLFLDRMQAACLPTHRLDLPGSWRTMDEEAHEEAINDHRVRRWLVELPRPCAVLTWSETVAHHVAELCHGVLTFGHDLLLVSASDDPSLLTALGISGVGRDVDRIASQAVASLAAMLDGQSLPGQPYLVAPLAVIERRSTNPALFRDPAIERALEVLRRHSAEPATLEMLCQAAGLPERSFRRRFLAAVGRSPRAESSRLRLAQAQALLAAGVSLGEAAQRCGFSRADSLARALAGGLDPAERP